ncbi:MAG: hypothetical protein ACK41T_00820 [Pseudobdellovibrio sp.]
MIIGIDSGKSGAFAIMEREEINLIPMPLIDKEIDVKAISDMLLEIRSEIKLVVLEDIFAIPSHGASSMLSFGRNHGRIEGVLIALKIPYIMISAKTWQNVLLKGVLGDTTKTRAYKVASKLFPLVELKKGRSKNYDEGFVDALLIAEYGKRCLSLKEQS